MIYFVKHLVGMLKNFHLKEGIYYFISEGINIWNDRIPLLVIGKKYSCNICGYQGRFLHKSNRLGIAWNSRCPMCDSRSRHRGLSFLYRKLIPEQDSVLHFAPEPVLMKLFERNNQYKTTDYFLEDVDYPRQDIQQITIDQTFDWVLCNHVVEHVADDEKALMNIARLLKHDGTAVITIPGDFTRKKTVIFKNLDLNGHYRDYGLDVVDKLKKYFGHVDTINLQDFAGLKIYAIKDHEIAFICKK